MIFLQHALLLTETYTLSSSLKASTMRLCSEQRRRTYDYRFFLSMCSSSLPTIFYCLSMYSMSKDVSSYQAAAFFVVVFCAYLILRKRRIQCLV
ncbi:hypothetical protein BJ912DRAFT_979566, partial [Pholiota molesta]